MVPGHSRGEVGMASSPGGYLVPRCAHARLGFGILLPCQGPLPAWPGHTRRHGSSMWLRRAGPNDSPCVPGMCQAQPGRQQRMRMRR